MSTALRRLGRAGTLALAGMVGGCLLALPAAVDGQIPSDEVSVDAEVRSGEELDVRVSVRQAGTFFHSAAEIRLDEPAYVALFEVEPGVGATLLFPHSVEPAEKLEAGVHSVRLHTPRTDAHRRTLLWHFGPAFAMRGLTPLESHLVVVASREPLDFSDLRSGRAFGHTHAYAGVEEVTDALLAAVVPDELPEGSLAMDGASYSRIMGPGVASLFGARGTAAFVPGVGLVSVDALFGRSAARLASHFQHASTRRGAAFVPGCGSVPHRTLRRHSLTLLDRTVSLVPGCSVVTLNRIGLAQAVDRGPGPFARASITRERPVDQALRPGADEVREEARESLPDDVRAMLRRVADATRHSRTTGAEISHRAERLHEREASSRALGMLESVRDDIHRLERSRAGTRARDRMRGHYERPTVQMWRPERTRQGAQRRGGSVDRPSRPSADRPSRPRVDRPSRTSADRPSRTRGDRPQRSNRPDRSSGSDRSSGPDR